MVRVAYDNGCSFKTLLCTKSDLAGEISDRMREYSSLYRQQQSVYDPEEEEKLCQLFQRIEKPIKKGRWLQSLDVLGEYVPNKSASKYLLAKYYEDLALLELEFRTRIRAVKYSCSVNGVEVERTILIDDNWVVGKILAKIMAHMQPQLNGDLGNYHLAWIPKNSRRFEVLDLNSTLSEQGVLCDELSECNGQPSCSKLYLFSPYSDYTCSFEDRFLSYVKRLVFC
eukprot:CAMPEP_0174269388 /NCGR_PEP_ID=MMETSP0439-20130205/40773_1 /TAXON_ID=0 /ORGANISM="Stereomyxa ramosa, Strain Chinc5" /LENGTH=225 /DNA_ID=CAMNT_0015358123 /DNA_START=325 /DNA_END=1002 /DNA_ORIENTATION=+